MKISFKETIDEEEFYILNTEFDSIEYIENKANLDRGIEYNQVAIDTNDNIVEFSDWLETKYNNGFKLIKEDERFYLTKE